MGLRALNEVVTQVIKRNLVGDVKSGVFYEDLSQLTLYADHVDPISGQWTNVLMHDDRDQEAPLLVLAQTGEINAIGSTTDEVKIEMHDGHVHLAKRASTEYTFLSFAQGQIEIGVYDSIWRKNTFRSSKEEQTPRELYIMAKRLKSEGGDWLPFIVSFHLRLAQAFAPIAFAFLGTSLALGRRLTRRSGGGYFSTILGYIAYYVLVRTFENLANQGRLSPLLAGQLPNVIFAAIGIVTLLRLTGTRARA